MSIIDLLTPEQRAELLSKSAQAGPEDNLTVFPGGYTAAGIMATNFPEPLWIVLGLICEGLIIFGGPPKVGKSWLCLALAIAIAAGGRALGKIKVDRGEVLYLALEDTPRRLKKRLTMILQGESAPDGFHIFTEWKKLDKGGLQALEIWLDEHPACKMVIVDTLGKIRGKISNNGNIYQEDTATLEGLKKLADDHEISIMLVHHLRKMAAEDPLETLSGSTGISGSADGILILKRTRGAVTASLFVTGRDVEEQDLALSFDQQSGTWTILGDAADFRMSQERRAVVDALKTIGGIATPKDIAEIMGKNVNTVKTMMRKLSLEGAIVKIKYGTYGLNGNSFTVTAVTTVTAINTVTTVTDGLEFTENGRAVTVENKCNRLKGPESQAGQGIQNNGYNGYNGYGDDVTDERGDAWEPDEEIPFIPDEKILF